MFSDTILIVEDDDNDLTLIRRALRKVCANKTLRLRRDGQEALELLLDGPGPLSDLPQVVLLDMKLPRVDGLQVLRRLRADDRTRTLPIVILTSSDEPEDLLHCYRLGANSYVRKPIQFERFQETVALLGLYWSTINHVPQKG